MNKLVLLPLLLALLPAHAASFFEFEDSGPTTNAPIFFTLWRHHAGVPVQWMRIAAPTNRPPRTVSFSTTLPTGTNIVSVTAHTATDTSQHSNMLSFTNSPPSAPFNFRLAPMKANISLVVTGSVTLSP